VLLRALAEPRRQAILRLVWDEERSAGEIARAFDDVTFGAISQHLRVLERSGAVRVRRDGRHRLYRADKKALGPLARHLTALWQSHLDDLRTLAERAERAEDER
jgi:DNA-binding transcriptional ArsR family regulator